MQQISLCHEMSVSRDILYYQQTITTSALVATPLHRLLAILARGASREEVPGWNCAREGDGGAQTTTPCGGAVLRAGAAFDR
jgi:hypothetical protein